MKPERKVISVDASKSIVDAYIELEDLVNKAILNGYETDGNIYHVGSRVCQAMQLKSPVSVDELVALAF